MDQLIEQVRAYAAARGVKPATVLQYAYNASAKEWDRWIAGGSCTMRTAERVKAYMASNPPADPVEIG